MYFLNKTKFLNHHDKIYVFDKMIIQAAFLKRYYNDELIKHLKTKKTIKLLICKYY